MNRKKVKELIESIRDRAMEHPAFDGDCFDDRDYDTLVAEGGEICDWTLTAIEADDALKEMEK